MFNSSLFTKIASTESENEKEEPVTTTETKKRTTKRKATLPSKQVEVCYVIDNRLLFLLQFNIYNHYKLLFNQREV